MALPSAVKRWFFAPTMQYWAVMCRIGFGFCLFAAWLFYAPVVQELFGPQGLGGAATIARLPHAELALRDFRYVAYLRYIHVPTVIWLLYGVLLLSALSFAAGCFTRTSGVVLVLLHTLFVARMPYAVWGWAMMIHAFTSYTILAHPGRYVSLDAWFRGRKTPDASPGRIGTAPLWPKRLMQVHVCTMYAVVGWARLSQPGWIEGGMTYEALTNLMFARADLDWHAWIPLLRASNYIVYCLEPLVPVLFWLPTVGPWCVIALMGLHLGLELTTTVGWWNYVLMLALLTFLPDAWLQRFFMSIQKLRIRRSHI
jgi:Vitamin K-dependent gamma-carboxylase